MLWLWSCPCLSRRLVYMPTGDPFKSNFLYESLILSCEESCAEEELAAFELLKTIFPWVALPLACCCCCYCQRRSKREFGWLLLRELALSSRCNPCLCPSLPNRRRDPALRMSLGAVSPLPLPPLWARSSQILPWSSHPVFGAGKIFFHTYIIK